MLERTPAGGARDCIARLAEGARGPSVSSDGRFLLWPTYEPDGMSDWGHLALHVFETHEAMNVGDVTLYTAEEDRAFQAQELPALPRLLCDRGNVALDLMTNQAWRPLREIDSLAPPAADDLAPVASELDVGCPLTFEVYSQNDGANAILREAPKILMQKAWPGSYQPPAEEPTCSGYLYALGGWLDPELRFAVLSAEYSTLSDACPTYTLYALQRLASGP